MREAVVVVVLTLSDSVELEGVNGGTWWTGQVAVRRVERFTGQIRFCRRCRFSDYCSPPAGAHDDPNLAKVAYALWCNRV